LGNAKGYIIEQEGGHERREKGAPVRTKHEFVYSAEIVYQSRF